MESSDKRLKRDKFIGIIIHHTGVNGRKDISDSLWKSLFTNIANYLIKKDANYVSAHYIIGRSGETEQLVNPETHEAFHAGKSQYWHPYLRRVASDWNRYAIGIELLGDGNLMDYTEAQYRALADLCRKLKAKFPQIHPMAITGHENIAWPPGRKDDPGAKFDWEKFFKYYYVG